MQQLKNAWRSRLTDTDLLMLLSHSDSLQSKGLQSLPRLVLFTSADAHYSVKKLASFMGIGTDNVYLINTDDIGKMDADHLGKKMHFHSILKWTRFDQLNKNYFRLTESEILRAKSEGALPFMVSATAGNKTCFRRFVSKPLINFFDRHDRLGSFWPTRKDRRFVRKAQALDARWRSLGWRCLSV